MDNYCENEMNTIILKKHRIYFKEIDLRYSQSYLNGTLQNDLKTSKTFVKKKISLIQCKKEIVMRTK